MTRDTYYEMCEMLGSEPLEEEIPVEFEDFDLDTQEAFTIYQMLQDTWDPMGGQYLGKNYSGLMDILALNEIEDKKTMFTLIKKLDEHRSNYLRSKTPKKPSA